MPLYATSVTNVLASWTHFPPFTPTEKWRRYEQCHCEL